MSDNRPTVVCAPAPDEPLSPEALAVLEGLEPTTDCIGTLGHRAYELWCLKQLSDEAAGEMAGGFCG